MPRPRTASTSAQMLIIPVVLAVLFALLVHTVQRVRAEVARTGDAGTTRQIAAPLRKNPGVRGAPPVRARTAGRSPARAAATVPAAVASDREVTGG